MNKRLFWAVLSTVLTAAAITVSVLCIRFLKPPSSPVTTLGTTPTTTTTTSITTVPTTTATVAQPFAFTDSQVKELDTLLANMDGNVSALYMDIQTGYTYRYNANARYNAASTMKAPYCLYLLEMANEGKCDLTKQITYTSDIISRGTGKIKNDPYGTQYTVETLIEYAIRYSDNAALRMLRNAYPADGFQQYAKTLGLQNSGHIGWITNSTLTVDEAAIYMQRIYTFTQNDPINGKKLREYMLKTTNPMFVSQYPLLRKYGWATKAFHDMAVAEAPHPYIIVMLTDHEDGNGADFAAFRNFSKKIENFSNR